MVLNIYNTFLLNIFMKILIFIVAANAITSQFNFDAFKKIDSFFNNDYFSKLIYIITTISIILLSIKKDTWLPFLGNTVLPATIIPETTNVGDTTIKIIVKPNTKVAYWSAFPSNENNVHVEKAYGDYSNAGVIKSDKDGVAILTFNKGSGYIVPSGKYIKPHIHYRELTSEYAMIGPVKTIYL